MQREKLHNLHRTAYFTVAFIYFENRQNTERSNFDVAKESLRRTRFFLIYHLICFIQKNTIHHKMQREKFYNLQRTVHIIYTAFFIKKKQNSE